jgi:hypothetical protein
MLVPSITMTLLYIGMGVDSNLPQAPVVIFFRAPDGYDIYKKPLELIQRPINSYMGWAIPPTGGWTTALWRLDRTTQKNWPRVNPQLSIT